MAFVAPDLVSGVAPATNRVTARSPAHPGSLGSCARRHGAGKGPSRARKLARQQSTLIQSAAMNPTRSAIRPQDISSDTPSPMTTPHAPIARSALPLRILGAPPGCAGYDDGARHLASVRPALVADLGSPPGRCPSSRFDRRSTCATPSQLHPHLPARQHARHPAPEPVARRSRRTYACLLLRLPRRSRTDRVDKPEQA
jgi:hypothetical protein